MSCVMGCCVFDAKLRIFFLLPQGSSTLFFRTRDLPSPMIYQSGYLTIKDFDKFTHSYLLDIPNNEVREGLLTILAN